MICFHLTEIVTILALFAAFISQISTLKIAISNFECGEYPRALMYLEMFVRENPQQFQEQLWLFMVRLNWCYIDLKTCLHYIC
jgi:outer membrane protein assembly factor BamD (BamD/ComL family)